MASYNPTPTATPRTGATAAATVGRLKLNIPPAETLPPASNAVTFAALITSADAAPLADNCPPAFTYAVSASEAVPLEITLISEVPLIDNAVDITP